MNDNEIKKLKMKIETLTDSNYCHDSIGRTEETEKKVSVVDDLLISIVAILIDKKIITKNEIVKSAATGWRIEDRLDL